MRRLLKNLAANGVGQGVGIIIQAVQVPLFLYCWGAELYGEWLLLTAWATYFALANLGFHEAAANDMAMMAAREKKSRALATFQSTFAFLAVAAVIGAPGLGLAIYLTPIRHWLNLTLLDRATTSYITFFLACEIACGFFSGLFCGAFRATGRAHIGALFNTSLRLGQFLIVSAALISGAGPAACAAIYAAAHLLFVPLILFRLRFETPWLIVGFHLVSLRLIGRLLRPALAFAMIPLARSLSEQGSLIVIGIGLGPHAAICYKAYRTLSNLLQQLSGQFVHAAWPELSLAHGRRDYSLARDLHARVSRWSIRTAMPIAIAMAIAGPWFVEHWTLRTVAPNSMLMMALLGAALLRATWYSSAITILAANRSAAFAVCEIAGAVVALLCAIPLTLLGIVPTAASLIVKEFIIAVPVTVMAANLLHCSHVSIAAAPFQFQTFRRPPINGKYIIPLPPASPAENTGADRQTMAG